MNALGLYLLVCLAFVIFALVEFAIAIILHRRKESKVGSEVVKKSPNIEKGTCVSLIPQIREVDPSKWKPKHDLNQTRLGTKNEVDNRSMPRKRMNFSMVPSTNDLDFIAIWIYLVLFMGFNCMYWNTK